MEFIQMKGLTLPIACAAILGGLLMPSRTQARAHEEVTVGDFALLHQNIRQATQRILQLGQSINDVGAYADQVGRQTRRDAKADADAVSQHARQDAIAHAHAVGRDAKKNALEGDAHTLQNANAYTNQKSDRVQQAATAYAN